MLQVIWSIHFFGNCKNLMFSFFCSSPRLLCHRDCLNRTIVFFVRPIRLAPIPCRLPFLELWKWKKMKKKKLDNKKESSGKMDIVGWKSNWSNENRTKKKWIGKNWYRDDLRTRLRVIFFTGDDRSSSPLIDTLVALLATAAETKTSAGSLVPAAVLVATRRCAAETRRRTITSRLLRLAAVAGDAGSSFSPLDNDKLVLLLSSSSSLWLPSTLLNWDIYNSERLNFCIKKKKNRLFPKHALWHVCSTSPSTAPTFV